MKGIVVAGIGTEVGKTVASAVIVESLQADYWKPIQAGELNNTDTNKVKALISNEETIFHPEGFQLSQPMSPHAAAKIDAVKIKADLLQLPDSSNTIIVELAGGIQVPLNEQETNFDLLKNWNLPVILVVNFYLGSINHTLLSIDALKNTGCEIMGLLFIGEENTSSKEVILGISNIKNLGHIPQTSALDKNFVSSIAQVLTFK
jgi:dethiobiotin synthetase